jgi:hypothetical protein
MSNVRSRERNVNVEKAVDTIIRLVDKLSLGEALGDPAPDNIKSLFDDHAAKHKGSARLAAVFLLAYSLMDDVWDFKSVPTGTRGEYGDKKLAAALTDRHVTFHNAITAYGENLGWKGNVRNFDLSKDGRFWPFLSKLQQLTNLQRSLLLNHAAWRLFDSRIVPKALPPLPSNYLSYAKSLYLCEKLLNIPSEGHIQQFLVAAFLQVHRRRYGHQISTHHPHASDKFDGTLGDIEEFRDEYLVAAYEVTVRPDWKNRLPDFGKKVEAGKLPKYVIFASDVRADRDLCPAEHLVKFVGRLPYDLAVIDLKDFFSVFCAELSQPELGQAFNTAYQFLCEPALSGRHDFQQAFLSVTGEWMESK